jgi:hypothetical protein
LFKNKTLDRISLAFAILSAWALSALYVWVFTTKTITYDAWGIMALLCAACHPLVAIIFTLIGWRYVLTGDDLPPVK